MAKPTSTSRRNRLRLAAVFAAIAVGIVAALAGGAFASGVDESIVDATAPTGSVTLAPGGSGSITINLSVTGNQVGTAMFDVNRNWTLSGGAFIGSNPQTFTVPPRAAADPATTFSTTGTITVDSSESAEGPLTLAVGAFNITNSNQTGAKLAAGNPSSYSVAVETPTSTDATAPVITFQQTPNGSNDWFKTAPATVTVTATDSDDGGVASLSCKLDGAAVTLTNTGSTSTTMYGDVSTSTDGDHTVSCQAADSTGNTAYYADNRTHLKLDKINPSVSVTGFTDGQTFVQGVDTLPTVGCSRSDDTSGIDSSGSTGPTITADNRDAYGIGSVTYTCGATDNAGNTNTASAAYSVTYNFTGFFQPVDNPPTCNTVKAGQAIPVKFSLNGYHGMNIFASGYPQATAGSCPTNSTDPIGETVAASQSGLTYDSTNDQYVYVWKTDKAWAGKAILLTVKFADGTTTKIARFAFTR